MGGNPAVGLSKIWLEGTPDVVWWMGARGKGFQLNEIRRNLRAIDKMIHRGAVLLELDTQLYRKLLVTSELYRQQQEMYDADERRVDKRIVNLTKPHVHPIVKGQSGPEN